MATSFSALCHDFYINQKLSLKMDLPSSRETLLDLFARVRKSRPAMDRFRRFDHELALESSARDGCYEWLALRQNSVRTGAVNPESLELGGELHRLVLEIAPYYLSINALDIDYLELMYGFDLEAPNHHDEIVFDALFADTPLGKLNENDQMAAMDVQPIFSFALDPARQYHVTYEVKTRAGDPESTEEGMPADAPRSDEPISIFMSIRRMGPLDTIEQLIDVYQGMSMEAERLANDQVVPQLLTPISKAISSRSR